MAAAPFLHIGKPLRPLEPGRPKASGPNVCSIGCFQPLDQAEV
jgi:hypothetical protein